MSQELNITVVVKGQKITIELRALLAVNNPEQEREECAVWLAYYGELYAAAAADHSMCEAKYRNWRGQQLRDLSMSQAEWKSQATTDGNPDFMKHKTAIATAQHAMMALERVVDGLWRKASICDNSIRREAGVSQHSNSIGRDGSDQSESANKEPAAVVDKGKAAMQAANQRRKQ